MAGRTVLLLALALACAVPSRAAFTCAPTNIVASCGALADLYAATNGAAWTSRTGWSSSAAGVATDYCTFGGVLCSGSDIVELSLPQNNLVGTLPAGLGALTSLTYLNLSTNALSGTVPPQLAALYLPCEGNNIVAGTGNTVGGCFNRVTGDGNNVDGRGNVVVGNSNVVNGTNDVVSGSSDSLINHASSDIIEGSRDTMDSDAMNNELYGSDSFINYHASNNTMYGSHSFLQLDANGNTVIGDYNTMQDNIQDNYVLGQRNVVQHGALRNTVVGAVNVLQNGATDDEVHGNHNSLQYGATSATVTGFQNVLQYGADRVQIDGSRNTVRDGAQDITVEGRRNAVSNDVSDDHVSGDYNTVAYGAHNNTVMGTKNALQTGSNGNYVDGAHNVLNNDAQDNQVTGDWNRMQRGSYGNEVWGYGNSIQSDASSNYVEGDYDNIQRGVSSNTVHGTRNNLQNVAHHNVVAGDWNTLQDATSDTVVGNKNTLQYHVTNSSVTGRRNVIKYDEASDTVIGNWNVVLNAGGNNEITGNRNAVQYGATNDVVVGNHNTVQLDASSDVISGDHNSLEYGASSNNIDGSYNILKYQTNGNSISGSLNTLEEAANNNRLVGNSNYFGHSASDNVVAGDYNAVHDASQYNLVYGKNNSATSGAFNNSIRGSQDFVVAANATSIIGSSDFVQNVTSPSTSVRGDGNNVMDTIAGTYIRVDADSVNVQRVTASGFISAAVNYGFEEDSVGASITVVPQGPGRRRNLQQLARFDVYSTKALATADLSGNQLTWTCDPAGGEGPPNDPAVCAAMQTLYRTNGWSALAPMDRWPTRNYCTSLVAGLSCNGDGEVDSLLLNASGLVGTLPPQLSSLTALTALRLDGNSLSGRIPAIAAMPKLVKLRLANSGLCGTVPPALFQEDVPAIAACPASPPSPPSPPLPPNPPPPPSPAPVFGPLAGFGGGVACPGVVRRFESALPDTTQGSTPVYRDTVEGSTWNLTAVAATGGAPPAAHTGLPLIGPSTNAPTSVDIFSVPHQAWLFRGSEGGAMQVSPNSYLGTSLGFSFAIWFRVDAAHAANPAGNVLMQLSAAAGPGHSVVLSLLAAFNNSGVLSVVAQFAGSGASTTDADYAVSSSSDEFGAAPTRPNGGDVFSAIGDWQHAAVTFNGAGLQTGLYWNGRKQDASPYWEPLDLGLFFGGPAPYGPILGGSVGFDANAAGPTVFAPLVGAVGDVQIYGYELDAASAMALASSFVNLCTPLPQALSPPPLPPAPPGGYSPPPPRPPPRAPRPPAEKLLSGILSLCLSGSTAAQLDPDMLESGLQSYLSVLPSQVRYNNASDGCDLSLISARRLLLSRATVAFIVADVTSSQVAATITPLFGAGSTAARAALLAELAAAGVAASGVAPLGAGFVPASQPPPVSSPPLPPGVTPASVLAAANAGKHANNGVLERLRKPEAIVGLTIAALAVLFVPVYFVLQCAQAGHERRTCVSAALVFHVAQDAQARSRAFVAAAAAASAQGLTGAEAEEAARFKAPELAAVLQAQLGAAVELGGYSAKRTLLRPLLRAPLLAALGAAAKPEAAFPGDDAASLALRHKPTSLRLKLKRSLRTELHWQARELRQLWRRAKRLFSRSADAGRVFRHAPEAAVTEGTSAILVEVTWKFASRDGASAWRHRMRDEAHLAALEATLQAALTAARDAAAAPLEMQPVAAGCTLALLDDEPYSRLDKKRGQKGAKGGADDTAPPDGAGARTHGLSPAVAKRLQEVLRLSLRSLTLSRASLAARRVSLRMSTPGATLRSLFATSPRASAIEERDEHEEEEAEAEAPHAGDGPDHGASTRVELLAAVSTQVDEPANAEEVEVEENEQEEEQAQEARHHHQDDAGGV